MSDNQDINDQSVDRHVETVITEQPGFAATEQVTRDVATERRLLAFQIDRIVLTILGILQILLGLRFVLKLIAANPNAGFTIFIYGITGVFLAPFHALLGSPTFNGSVLEVTTLIAMAVYALFFWIVVRVIQIVIDRPTARTITRSRHEQSTSGGPGR